MFICTECLEASYKNSTEFVPASIGPCEVCGVKKLCNDIRSSALIPKEVPVEVVKAKVIAAYEKVYEADKPEFLVVDRNPEVLDEPANITLIYSLEECLRLIRSNELPDDNVEYYEIGKRLL